jgi:HK97 family phage prohead protease
LLWDHDLKRVLAGTNNGTLALRTDPKGLHFRGRIAPFSYAKDLRMAMESGLVRQASFSFVPAKDGTDWDVASDGTIVRTIRNVRDLFDVTISAQGAYPQSVSQLAPSVRSYLKGVSQLDRAKKLAEIQRYARARVRQFEAESAKMGLGAPVRRRTKRRKSIYERKLEALGMDKPMRDRVSELGPKPNPWLEPVAYAAWESRYRVAKEEDDYERLCRIVAMQRLADQDVIKEEIRQEQRERLAELEWRKSRL